MKFNIIINNVPVINSKPIKAWFEKTDIKNNSSKIKTIKYKHKKSNHNWSLKYKLGEFSVVNMKELLINEISEKIKDLIELYNCDKMKIEVDCNKKTKSVKIHVNEIEFYIR